MCSLDYSLVQSPANFHRGLVCRLVQDVNYAFGSKFVKLVKFVEKLF